MQTDEKEDVGVCPTCGKPFSEEESRSADKERSAELVEEIRRLKEELASIWG